MKTEQVDHKAASRTRNVLKQAQANVEREITELMRSLSFHDIFFLFLDSIDLKPDDNAWLVDVIINDDGELVVELDITFTKYIGLSWLLDCTGQEHRIEEFTKLLTPALQR